MLLTIGWSNPLDDLREQWNDREGMLASSVLRYKTPASVKSKPPKERKKTHSSASDGKEGDKFHRQRTLGLTQDRVGDPRHESGKGDSNPK